MNHAELSTRTVGKYVFTRGAPFPRAKRAPSAASVAGEPPFPFADMFPGESYVEAVTVPDSITCAAEREKSYVEISKKLKARVYAAVQRFRKRHPLASFIVREVATAETGYGVFIGRNPDNPAGLTKAA